MENTTVRPKGDVRRSDHRGMYLAGTIIAIAIVALFIWLFLTHIRIALLLLAVCALICAWSFREINRMTSGSTESPDTIGEHHEKN